MIEIKNLSFRYDKKFYALFNIALTIYDNQNILMSCEQELETQTLFRILSKQEKDYSGDIYFDNKNLKEIKTANLDVCYITKTPYLLKNKSVFIKPGAGYNSSRLPVLFKIVWWCLNEKKEISGKYRTICMAPAKYSSYDNFYSVSYPGSFPYLAERSK